MKTELLPERARSISSVIAIQKTMIAVKQSFLANHPLPKDPSVREKKLESITAGCCLDGCCLAVKLLTQNYPDLFRTIDLLHYEKLETTREKKPIGVFHEYFLAQDREETWYAGSPANHIKHSGENSRLKRIFSGKNLQEVLDRIAKEEGGIWPTEEHIIDTLKKYRSPDVKYNGETEYIQFIRENTGREYEILNYSLPEITS